MASLLIVAHAPLATSLQAVARHAYPDCGALLAAVDIAPGLGLAQAETAIRGALEQLPGPEALILVDTFGATPCNAALAVADGQRSRVVAGVNVPMLWRTLCYADRPLEDLIERALAGAAQGVMQVGSAKRQNQPTPPRPHGHDTHHDQQ